MIRTAISFIIVLLLGISIFYSCSSDDLGKNTYPTIEIIHPTADTVVMTDTFYSYKIRFTNEDDNLSSYTVKIWNTLLAAETDTFTLKSTLLGEQFPVGSKDSAIFNRAFQYANIFGKRDTTITVVNGYKIDSLIDRTHVLLGEHWFKVSVTNKRGNVAADSFKINVVKYVNPSDR